MDLYPLLLHALFLGILKPVTSGVVIAAVSIVILLFCSALISGSEIAFFSLTARDKEEHIQKNKTTGMLIQNLLEKPQKLLATILISNNFINISIVILATYITIQLFDLTGHYFLSFFIEFVVITSMILLFGEMLPKIYANQNPVRFAQFMARPMNVLIKLFHPLSHLLVSSTSFIERRLMNKKQEITLDELSEAIDITTDVKTHQQEKKILKGIVKFGDIQVSEVMKPRIDVASVEYGMKYPELLKYIRETGFSRIPVYQKTFDHIVGILYIKDLLQYLDMGESFTWQNLIRPPFYVPENMKINDLLNEFKEKKIHMAIVVDEYGGSSGIVTLEDVIEEIVGEINDEYDLESENVDCVKLDDYNFIFDGKTSLNDLTKRLNLPDDFFDNVRGDAESVAGLILETMGRIPQRNEMLEIKGIVFTIEWSDNRRIKKVKVTIKPSVTREN